MNIFAANDNAPCPEVFDFDLEARRLLIDCLRYGVEEGFDRVKALIRIADLMELDDLHQVLDGLRTDLRIG